MRFLCLQAKQYFHVIFVYHFSSINFIGVATLRACSGYFASERKNNEAVYFIILYFTVTHDKKRSFDQNC